MDASVKKNKKSKKHMTLPWGMEAADSQENKLKKDSLVKSPPPYRYRGKSKKVSHREVVATIMSIYPDDEDDKSRAQVRKKNALNGPEQEAQLAAALGQESPIPEKSPALMKTLPAGTPADLGPKVSSESHLENDAVNSAEEKGNVRRADEALGESVGFAPEPTGAAKDKIDSIVPPLGPVPALERRLVARDASEDRGKLKFIVMIAGGVTIMVLAVVVVLLYFTDTITVDSGKAATAKSSTARVVPPSPAAAPVAPSSANGAVSDNGSSRDNEAESAQPDSPAPVADKERKASVASGEDAMKNAEPAVVSPTATASQVNSEPAETAEPPEPAETAALAAEQDPPVERDENSILIRVGGVPRTGQVYINNKLAEKPFYVPKGEKAVKVEVRAPGYKSATKRVVPIRDKTVTVRLKKK